MANKRKTDYGAQYDIVSLDELRRLRALEKNQHAPAATPPSESTPPEMGLRAAVGLLALLHLVAAFVLVLKNNIQK
jgi:hypothetical protein